MSEFYPGFCDSCVNDGNIGLVCTICKKVAGGAPTKYISKYYYKASGGCVDPAEAVNHPAHYQHGSIEPWDFIADQGLCFDCGNAVKYICRAGTKEGATEEEDIEKAIEYLQHRLKVIRGAAADDF